MSTLPLRKEEVLTEDNVLSVDFKNKEKKPLPAFITGGPTGPENWLQALDKGTIFLAKKKSDVSLDMLYKYLILEHLKVSTNMIWGTPDGKNLDVWVDTLDFSRKYRFHEVVGQIGLPEDQQEKQVEHESGETPPSETPGRLAEAPESGKGSQEGPSQQVPWE